jgi:cbb3-type cytochrome oxidase subunit 1
MPAVTRWFIKAGLAYFLAALLLGVILAAPAVMQMPPAIAVWGPVYFHLFMVGWVTQLIFGVVYWMFPRYSKDKPRGREGLAVATFVLLNIGLVLRAIGEPIHSLWRAPAWAE